MNRLHLPLDLMKGKLLGAFVQEDIRNFRYMVNLSQQLGSAKLARVYPEDEAKILPSAR